MEVFRNLWQAVTTEGTIFFNFISFLASFVTIGGVFSLAYYFLHKRVTKKCQKKILLDLMRHVFVNCAIVEIVRAKLMREGNNVCPVEGVFRRFVFLDNDMDLARFSVTSRSFERIHSTCLSMRNYNIAAEMAEKHIVDRNVPLEIKIADMYEVFNRGVAITKKFVRLGKEMGFKLEVSMVENLFSRDFAKSINGIYDDKWMKESDILPRDRFRNHSYYDENGLTSLFNENLMARVQTIGFVSAAPSEAGVSNPSFTKNLCHILMNSYICASK